MNLYQYVQGDPINNIDPRGADTIVVTGTRIGCKGTCITDPDLIRDFLNSFNQSRNSFLDFSGAGGGTFGDRGEEQPGKEDSCAQQQSYANPNQYVSAGQLEGVLQNAIENTSFAQFSFPELGNGIDRFGPRYTATSRGFVDLQHVVYSGFSASGAFGLGEARGFGLEVFQFVAGPTSNRFRQSAFLQSDFYSNSLGQAAANDFYWGGFDGSLAQSMVNQITSDGVLSQQEAQAQADASCSEGETKK